MSTTFCILFILDSINLYVGCKKSPFAYFWVQFNSLTHFLGWLKQLFSLLKSEFLLIFKIVYFNFSKKYSSEDSIYVTLSKFNFNENHLKYESPMTDNQKTHLFSPAGVIISTYNEIKLIFHIHGCYISVHKVNICLNKFN